MRMLLVWLAVGVAAPAVAQDGSYRVAVGQELQIESGGERHTALRDLSYVLTITQSRQRGDSVVATLTFDSVRGAMNTPHGRELMDLRPLNGTRVVAMWPRSGGPLRFEQRPPTADYAVGGEMSLAEPLAYLFPPLPASAWRPGLAWTGATRRVSVEGNTSTQRRPAFRYTLARVENGVARVELGASDGPSAGQGPLTVAGHVLVVAADRSTREVQIREQVSGRYAFGAEQLPYRQSNTISLVRR